MRKKRDSLEEALTGLIGAHQKMMLSSQLCHIDFLDSEIARLDEEIGRRLEADIKVMDRLDETGPLPTISSLFSEVSIMLL